MAKPLGMIVNEVLEQAARLADFQSRLNDMADPEQRKQAIMTAHGDGFLCHDETQMLFQVYGLTVE